MVQASTIFMASLMFCLGLLIGLIFHLPGASQPTSPIHGGLGAGLVRSRRELLQVRPNRTSNMEEVDMDDLLGPERLVSEAHFRKFEKHSEYTRHSGDSDSELDISVTLLHKDKHSGLKLSDDVKDIRTDTFPQVQAQAGLKSTVTGIYWSPEAESLAPDGFSDEDVKKWRNTLAAGQVVSLQPGCGRMQNRQITLDDANQGCARYRQNMDQIQGEIYSYFLSRVLGIYNVPPSVLLQPDPMDDHWRRVQHALTTARWSPDRTVIATPWIHGLEADFIPQQLRTDARRLHPEDVQGASETELKQLVQWSDLIVFDYLTANLDRVVNNMYNRQWNPQMMDNPAHNLERESGSGRLVFLDNESGLFHSYRLLDKYAHYHTELLQSLCVFRRSTVDSVRRYVKSGNIAQDIMESFRTEDPLSSQVPKLPRKTVTTLNQRLGDVEKQISWCEQHFS